MEIFDEAEVQEIRLDYRNYPKLLRQIEEPPKVLRHRGPPPPNRNIIAISGSRKTTRTALETAYRIGKLLAQDGYTIGTGFAPGCDTFATERALSEEGTVIGIVPRGLKYLRRATKQLAEKVFATGGTVISEYPDDHTTAPSEHYLRRNAIITGLSEKTIIIAAAVYW